MKREKKVFVKVNEKNMEQLQEALKGIKDIYFSEMLKLLDDKKLKGKFEKLSKILDEFVFDHLSHLFRIYSEVKKSSAGAVEIHYADTIGGKVSKVSSQDVTKVLEEKLETRYSSGILPLFKERTSLPQDFARAIYRADTLYQQNFIKTIEVV